MTENIDILMLSETKLDSRFSEGQFLIPGLVYRIGKIEIVTAEV